MNELDEEFDLDEEDDDSPFCECGLEPTIEEADWNVCDCCGKPLN